MSADSLRPPNGRRPSAMPGGRTLGPVSDLERHLPHDWWRTLFNAIYLKTDGDVVENQANTARDVDLFIGYAGLEPNDRILDVCCGQGRHVLELARRGFGHVTGIDRSRYLIRLARKRAQEASLACSFHEGDARRFRLGDRQFDVAMILGNSFGYFARAEDDAAVLGAVKRVLRSRGRLLLDLTDGAWMKTNFEPRSWEWIDQNHFVCRERSLAADDHRLISREVVVHAERGVIADQFYAERLYERDEAAALLEQEGFTDIRLHDVIESQSDRNQDLGMMARRLVITCEAPLKVRKIARHEPARNVTVVMGDPRLADDVKRGGVFNPEDHETIRRLKDALSELDDYNFSYLDNHATLEADIRRQQPDFVLNLCDEGFHNDAFRELHVPAFLEMHDVPYTGAGPASLGLCYNKALVRAIAQGVDVPVPLETYFDPDDQAANLPSVFPALIKPATGDSSIGITQHAVVRTPAQAEAYLRRLRNELPGRPVLVQEFLSGPEYSVGLLGNAGIGLRALPVLEVDYSKLDPSLPRLLPYESKWHPDSPYWTDISYREAEIPEDLRRHLVDWAMILFERLDCRDYARVDFRADADGNVKLLEMNPNPGWCWDGKFNLMAGFAGMRYADLLREIIEAAFQRAATKQPVREPAAFGMAATA